MANRVLTHNLSEALGGVTTAIVNIDTGTGNLMIDRLIDDEPVLASGELQYYEKEGAPIHTLDVSNGQATLTLSGRGGIGRSRFRFPWSACNGAFDWQIHINPSVPSEIMAHSGGGNVKLDLSGMAITRVAAESGGGNLDVTLPDIAANLDVTAKTGGGNVTITLGSGTTGINSVQANSGAGNVGVRVPSSMAAKIHASTGLGKVIVDQRFSQIDKDTYQSSNFESAVDKVEITLKSGAGNVSIETR